MKIKFLANAYENGMNYKIGDIAEIEDKRAKQLIKVHVAVSVEVEPPKKAFAKPPKDKAIHRSKRK
jgi:hypothetical protein